MFIWSCGGLAPFLMRMICCEDGRSQDAEAKPAPFNSLTAANGITLKAGESLLLKAGTTCTSATQTIDGASVKTGLRVINAKGTKDAPITIGAYGEGASFFRGEQARHGPRADGAAGGAGRSAGAAVSRPVVEPYQS